MSTSTMLIAQEWIVTTLKADANISAAVGNRVYVTENLPQNPTYPYIEVRQFLFDDVGSIGGYINLWRPQFIVVAVTRGHDYGPLESIADDIRTALHRKRGATTSRGTMHGALQIAPHKPPPAKIGDAQQLELGGRFEVFTDA